MNFLLLFSSRAMRPRILGKSKAISGLCAFVKLFSTPICQARLSNDFQSSRRWLVRSALFLILIKQKSTNSLLFTFVAHVNSLAGCFCSNQLHRDSPFHRCLTGNKLASQERKNSKPQTLATTINWQAKELLKKRSRKSENK